MSPTVAIPILPDPADALLVGPPPEFQVELPVFEGPLPLLLHLIESAELDIRTVSLASVADGYVTYLASHPVDSANLAQFVAIAAQLILIKSRSLLPAEPGPELPPGAEDIDEEELRRRLLVYRAIRDAARDIAARDDVAPMWHREPRLSDLPEAPVAALDPGILAAATALPWPRSRSRRRHRPRSSRARSRWASRSASCATPWAKPGASSSSPSWPSACPAPNGW